ncbi:hypothetical protein L218DRAFT_1074761 [Marasmius fiardii PR-910]|nr:hypothetical protein L218DRAFT_1074761 [Marasmius fiardii PR-910]
MQEGSLLPLGLLVLYYLIERCFKFLLRRRSTSFFDHLYASHKLPVFTGIAMGTLITAITTPSCMRAAYSLSSPDTNVDFCFIGRGILWVAELNRLDLYELYVVHHLGSLLALFLTVLLNWPYQPFLIILSSLVSEIPGDFLWLSSAYRDYRSSTVGSDGTWNTAHTFLVGFNLLQYTIIRFSAMGYAFFELWGRQRTEKRMERRQFLIACAMMIGHAAFCMAYVARQYGALQKRLQQRSDGKQLSSETPEKFSKASPEVTWSVEATHQPYHITIIAFGTRWFFTIYGIFMGMGLAALTATATILCPSLEPESMALVISSAVLGARLFSLVFEDGLKQFFHAPLPTLFRPGFWLHGGIVGAVFTSIYLAYTGTIPDIITLWGSLAVGLPLFEFFSRIGCHCYGCCYGRPFIAGDLSKTGTVFWYLFPPVVHSHASSSALSRVRPSWVGVPLIPIQLASAAGFLGLFFCTVPLIAILEVSVPVTGCIVLIGHSFFRFFTERFRGDYRGEGVKGIRWFTTTGLMALLQLTVAASLLIWMVLTRDLTATVNLGEPSMKMVSFSFSLGALVFGIHKGKIGYWM